MDNSKINVREEKRYYEIIKKPSVALLSSGNYMYTNVGNAEIMSSIPIPNQLFLQPPKALYQKTKVVTIEESKSKFIDKKLDEVRSVYWDDKKEHSFGVFIGGQLGIRLYGPGMNIDNVCIYTFLRENNSYITNKTTYKRKNIVYRCYQYNVWVRKCVYDINQMILKDKLERIIDEKIKVLQENNYPIDSMMGRDTQILMHHLLWQNFMDNKSLVEKYGEIAAEDNMNWIYDEDKRCVDTTELEKIMEFISKRKPKTPEEKWFAKFNPETITNTFASKEDIAAFDRYYKSYQEV